MSENFSSLKKPNHVTKMRLFYSFAVFKKMVLCVEERRALATTNGGGGVFSIFY